MVLSETLMQARTFFRRHESWVKDRIAAYVALESPSNNPTALDEMAALIEADFRDLGGHIGVEGRTPRPVSVSFGEDEPFLALILHHDTVWPIGSFPKQQSTPTAWYAPGIFDMKAGIGLVLLAARYLLEHDPKSIKGLRVICSPDEEVQGEASRTRIPELAKGCEWAMVFEPPAPGGAFKYKRKGVGNLELGFTGIATHAGNHYASGKSALAAAARFLLAAEGLSRVEEGFTVNVGLLRGGSASNTRPGHAGMSINVRVWQAADWERFVAFVEDYKDQDGVGIAIKDRRFMPPMHAEHEGWSMLATICGALDLPFNLAAVGGGSDGSHLAAHGLKVMDGLGVAGAGEHADNEHIDPRGIKDAFLRTVLLIQALQKGRGV